MKRTILIISLFILSAMSASAATWYDKLPESGEVAPKADTGGAQPNYQGNINSVTEDPIAPSAEVENTQSDDNAPVAGDDPSKSSSPWKTVLYIVVTLVVAVSGWVIIANKKK